MRNYSSHEIENLKQAAKQLYAVVNDADLWVNRNLKKEERDAVSLRIKNSRRVIRKIIQSVDSKPVFALFGASQVGKSYLIKNILSVDGKPLTIEVGEEKLDFLKQINPPGTGAESTGVVTRFSRDNPSPFPQFPVRSKLLNVKDILLIICDSFFSDLKAINNYPTVDEFIHHWKDVQQRFSSPNHHQDKLTEDDVFDIKDYFEKHFFKFGHYTSSIDKSQFWSEIGKIIERIPCANWVETFDILWCRNKSLSKLFTLLIEALQHIDFSVNVYFTSEAIKRGGGEILDVQRLKGLFDDDTQIKVKSESNKEYDIRTALLSALSAEITLPCDPSISVTKPFFNQTDLLDFPGARSRLELSLESLTQEAVPDLLLRGKVSYLFNKYSGDYEINNLLFCQNDKQLDVNELPSLIHDWICNNVGRNAEERDGNISRLPISPLFIIFTFFNNQLKFDTTNDDKDNIDYKWDTRFNRFFEKELVTISHDWHKNWTRSQPLFNNFYLLRDYKYSDDIFSGFTLSGREEGILPARIEFLQRLRTSFIGHDFVLKHFPRPELSFDSASLPNHDGSEHIIKNLEPAANNYIKIKNYSTQLSALNAEFTRVVSKYYYSDNLDDLRKKAISESVKVQLELNRMVSKEPELFHLLLKSFMLDEIEIYNYFHENLLVTISRENDASEYELFKSSFPDLNPDHPRQKNLEIIQYSLGLGSIDEVVNMLEEQGLDIEILFPKNKTGSASLIMDGIFDKWRQKTTEPEMQEFVSGGLSEASLEIIRRTFEKTMDRTDFKEFLLGIISQKYQGISLDKHTEEFLAAAVTSYFNEFICQAGMNWLGIEILENVKTLLPQLAVFINNVNAPDAIPVENELVAVFDSFASEGTSEKLNPLFDGYNSFLSKFKIALLSNCGFVDYDVAQNAVLNDLINKSTNLHFELTQ
jgi:hypothetical protein